MSAKQLMRMVAVAVLLAVLVVAVKSALPESSAADQRQEEPNDLIAIIVVHVVLVIAVVTLLFSILTSRRNRPRSPSEVVEFRSRLQRGPLTILYAVAAAAILLFLVVVGFLVPPPPGDGTDTPSTSDQADELSTDAEQPPEEPAPREVPASIVVLGGALLLLTGAGIAVAFVRRPAPETLETFDPTTPPEPAEDTLARAAAVGLAAVSEPGLDPRAAIIACYLAMETEFAHDPAAAPLESDTPTEVLARAVRRGAVHDAAAAELVGLFTEARFSRHDMTEAQRADAVRLLQRVERDLGVRP